VFRLREVEKVIGFEHGGKLEEISARAKGNGISPFTGQLGRFRDTCVWRLENFCKRQLNKRKNEILDLI
jgi:hypothetical protein